MVLNRRNIRHRKWQKKITTIPMTVFMSHFLRQLYNNRFKMSLKSTMTMVIIILERHYFTWFTKTVISKTS